MDPAAHPRALTDFIPLETLQALQDRFAALTGVATSFRHPSGAPITRTTGESEFCRLMQSTPTGTSACRASHTAAASSTGANGKACALECHAGLTQFAAPIMVEGRHVASIIMGERARTPLSEDAVRRLAAEHGLDVDQLRRAAWGLRRWSERELSAAVDFLQFLATALAQRCFQASQLTDRVQELTAVYRLASMLAGADDLKHVLKRSVSLICDVLGVMAASIRLLDEETSELKIAAVHNLSPEYLTKGAISLTTSRIDLEAINNGIVYIADQPNDPRTLYPAEARREGIVSALVAAMRYRGQAIGVLRVYADRLREFSTFEQSLLQMMASQMAVAIVDTRLRRDARDAEALERQIALGGQVQRRMIPAAPPRHKGLQLGAVYAPSLALGGDFYDFLELPDGNIGVAIADVVGKGVPASLTMASTRATLRALAKSIYHIDRIMAEVNVQICRDTLMSEFVTMFYGVFSSDGRRLTYCNAGHEAPLLLRGETLEPLETGGLVLGIDPQTTYDRGIAHLKPGDVLLMSTDGLAEGMNFAGEAYGRKRMEASMRQHRALDATALAKEILWDLRRFRGLADQSDDVSIVVAKVI